MTWMSPGPDLEGHRRGARGARPNGSCLAIAQLSCCHIKADLYAAPEPGHVGTHVVEPPVQVPFLRLELGDPERHQPPGASACCTPSPRDRPWSAAAPPQGRPTRSRSRPPPCARRRARRPTATVAPLSSHSARSTISTSTLTCLVVSVNVVLQKGPLSRGAGHSRPVNSGEIVGRVPPGLPVVPDRVVPLRDQVAQRAAQAAARLPLELGGGEFAIYRAPFLLQPGALRAAGAA